MQRSDIEAVGVLNTVAASGANVRDEVNAGYPGGGNVQLASNDVSGSAAAVLLCAPLRPAEIIAGYKMASQAEQRQIAVFGRPGGTLASPVTETIVANKRYKVEIIHNFETNEGGKKAIGIYSTVAPAVLSGNAATDRENIFTILKNKINAHDQNYGTAYLLRSVAFTGGTGTATFTIGETVTQTTSGVTAKVAGYTVTSGTIDGDNAAGVIYLYDFSSESSWSASSLALTGGTSGVVVTTAAALTLGVGLVFRDDAGYYPLRPATREGAPYLAASAGWEVLTAWDAPYQTLTKDSTGYHFGLPALYERGIGSSLAAGQPVFTPGHENIISGDAVLAMRSADFNVAKNYTQYTLIKQLATGPSDAGHGGITPKQKAIVIFVDESNSTNLANWETAVENALDITIV